MPFGAAQGEGEDALAQKFLEAVEQLCRQGGGATVVYLVAGGLGDGADTEGLGKRLVLLNNIFNPREFELYGRGVIVQPPQACSCFFQPRCTAPSFCLESLEPATVQVATLDLLGRP